MSRSGRITASPTLLRRLAFASLVANIGIVVTGAAVRLTGSGLGCPTWPRCTDESYTTTAEMGVHGVIEFSNRLLTFVLVAIAAAGFLAAVLQRPRRRSLILLSGVVLIGIPGQGVIGGITVLTNLNPWVVGLHFVLSIALIAGAYALWRRAGTSDEPARLLVPPPVRTLARLTAVVSLAVIVVGVIVTGSGPHSGDRGAKRNGLDPETISQVHADLVFLLVGLSVALWLALRAVRAPRAAVRAAATLIAVELAQGLIGFVQYFTHLPVALVAAHMLGATLVWTATLAVLWSLRERPGTDQTAAPATTATATTAPTNTATTPPTTTATTAPTNTATTPPTTTATTAPTNTATAPPTTTAPTAPTVTATAPGDLGSADGATAPSADPHSAASPAARAPVDGVAQGSTTVTRH